MAITMLVLFFVIYVVIWSTEAGGLNEIQSVGDDILYYNMDLNISMRNVMVSVILLSTLGAILDMALTVTTSVYEVKNHKSEMKFTELVESGMKIGREVIGTTVNSLELLLNSKILFQNFASMIFGAIACVMVMPIAAVLMAKMLAVK